MQLFHGRSNITITAECNKDYKLEGCSNITLNGAEYVSLYKCHNITLISCDGILANYNCTNLIIRGANTCNLSNYCTALSVSCKSLYIKDCDYSQINLVDVSDLTIHNRHKSYQFTVNADLEQLKIYSNKRIDVSIAGNVERVLHDRNVSIIKK